MRPGFVGKTAALAGLVAGSVILISACAGTSNAAPTAFSLGGSSQVLGFTPTPTPGKPQSAAKPTKDAHAPATPGGGPAPSGPVAAGQKFFIAQPCKACHTVDSLKNQGVNGNVGPNLTGIGARAETREPGKSAEQYLRESILDPGKFIAPGYPNAMPPGLVPEGPNLDNLIAFLLSLK